MQVHHAGQAVFAGNHCTMGDGAANIGSQSGDQTEIGCPAHIGNRCNQNLTRLQRRRLNDIPRHTLREALEKYRDTVSANKKGAKWEMSRINKFITTMPFINEQLTELKTSTLAQWRDDNLKKIQPASVRREMTVIASMFEIARREWGWIKESPLKDVKKPSSPPHRDRLIEDDEISRLINELGFVEEVVVVVVVVEVAITFFIVSADVDDR